MERRKQISALDYEPVMRLMHVGFENGRARVYINVPIETYLKVRFAASKEAVLRKYVVNRFRCA